ncbi:MAG: 30S ribosomal protein S17 [Patescibacteria group bacterium]|jgi:small subunit ribosomal protein S17
MNKEEVITKVKTLRGAVISDKADKTITVLVNRIKTHRLYKKKFTVSKKFKAHDPENEYHVGDTVDIAAARPISKDKHFVVVGKVK